MRAVKLHGEKWARIRDQGLIPGRSDAQLRERLVHISLLVLFVSLINDMPYILVY